MKKKIIKKKSSQNNFSKLSVFQNQKFVFLVYTRKTGAGASRKSDTALPTLLI